MKDSEKEHAEKQVSKVVAYSDFFKTKEGKAVFDDLLRESQYFQINPEDPDTLMRFRQGQKSIVNYIMVKADQNPAEILDTFRKRQKKELDYEFKYEEN